MKLGNYFQKSIPVKREQNRSIIVTNEHVQKDFEKRIKNKEAQIAELTKQIKIAEQKSIQSFDLYDDVQKRHTEALETIRIHEEQDAENFALRTRIGQLQPQVEKVAPLEQQFLQTKEKLTVLQTEQSKILHDFELLAIETTQDKQMITKLNADAIEAAFTISKYQGDHINILQEGDTLRNEFNLLKEQATQQVEDISLLSTNFFYWKDTAQSLNEQLEKESELRNEIQRTLTFLTQEHVLENKKSTKSSQAYNEAKTTILDLNTRNVDLTKFTDQLSKIILEQKKQLASVGRLSQGTIGTKENFHIPFAKENIRTVNLGNSAPTMLKFKENSNDDN